MKLNSQLKEDTGYSWVMTRVEPASPFGHALVRNPKWYGPGEQDKLEAEFSRVDTLLNLMGRVPSCWRASSTSCPSSMISAIPSSGPPARPWTRWSCLRSSIS